MTFPLVFLILELESSLFSSYSVYLMVYHFADLFKNIFGLLVFCIDLLLFPLIFELIYIISFFLITST